MAELKTKETQTSVDDFLKKIVDESVRDDCSTISKLMQKITGAEPRMWGPSIVGFGRYHYKYDSGHEGDMCLVGYSPRKPNLALYLTPDPKLLAKLGKHKAAKACIYVRRLKDIDLAVLEELIVHSVSEVKAKYGSM